MSVQLPVSIANRLKHQNIVWDADTVYRSSQTPLVATHVAKNGRECAYVDGRLVYVSGRSDGGHDAVGGINLPAVAINQLAAV